MHFFPSRLARETIVIAIIIGARIGVPAMMLPATDLQLTRRASLVTEAKIIRRLFTHAACARRTTDARRYVYVASADAPFGKIQRDAFRLSMIIGLSAVP